LNVEVDANIDIFTNNGSINLESLNDEFHVGYQNIVNEYEKDLITLPIDTDNILNIKETIRQKYIDRAFEIDKPSEALKELQNYIAKIFDGLDLTFNLSSIDYNKDIVLFKDSNGIEFDINDLSTGEKTLLSKVLYLFFEDYKDKVILIDEPELSLHPSWQNKVLQIYKNFAKLNTCQIIIATHSPHIIASADNESIRFLEKDEGRNIRPINDIQAYGRDVEWVLEQMGVKNQRVSEVLEKFTNCQKFLNDEKYDEAEICINELEEEIGKDDKQIMSLRNSLFFERN
jgi:hypothetical protein